MKPILHVVALLLALCCLRPLNGQAWRGRPKITDRIVWLEGGGWAHLPFSPGSQVTLVLNGQKEVIPTPLGGGNGWSISNGTIFTLSFAMDGHQERLWLNRRNLTDRGSDWERVAEIDGIRGIPLFLIPLKKPDDCYLALNWTEGFFDKEQASFAAIFRLKEGRMALDSIVDMPSPFSGLATRRVATPGVEAPAPVAGEPGAPSPRFSCEATMPGLHPSLWAPASVGDYVVLASSKSAVLWAFSVVDGQCKRVLNLHDLKAEDLPHLGALDHFLLAMQPTKKGTLLVATRSPEVIPAAKEIGRLAGKAASREMLARWAASPMELRWLEIDPVTWKVEQEPSYPWPLPQAGETFEQLSRFQFILDQDGRVKGNLKGPWNQVLVGAGLDHQPQSKVDEGPGSPGRPESDGPSLAAPKPSPTPSKPR